MLMQLKAGALDVMSNVGFAQIDQAKAITEMQVLLTPNMIWEHMDINLDNPLFKDVKVRQAVAFALDRQNMGATTLKGAAVIASADQPPSSWVFNPELQPFVRDINLARKLLGEAGWKPGTDGIMIKDGKRLSFNIATVSGNKTRENIQAAIQQQLREAGIEVRFSVYAPDYFSSAILRPRNFDMALYGYVLGADPDHTSLWHSRFIPSQANNYEGQNYSGWRNVEIDNLTVAGTRTYSLEERKQIYFRIQELVAQELPCIPLYFRANIDMVKKHVVGFQPSPTPAGNLWNAWEWSVNEK
jgi:peptide/nickel transport system substrate-binding protein